MEPNTTVFPGAKEYMKGEKEEEKERKKGRMYKDRRASANIRGDLSKRRRKYNNL